MTAVVLVGVMADRPALTLRTIAVAALAVMLLAPEAVVHPSFQMSFAATLALIATYERGIPWIAAGADTSLGARIALWGAREASFLMLASLVAGFATMPYAAYHFHRLAPYGVLANLLAMPVISAVSMPAGLLALVAMPFGFDGPLWRLMGVGIDWMIAVATWVAHLPGAVGHIHAFGIGALLLGTAGLIVLCLLRTPLRLCRRRDSRRRAPSCWRRARRQPDMLVDPRPAATGGCAARRRDGRLPTCVKTGSNDTLADLRMAPADGDARLAPAAAKAHEGFGCDDVGCVARLAGGGLVAIGTSPAALADDCRRAALVITTRTAPPGCGVTVIDRKAWRNGGALALRRVGKDWEQVATRPPSQDRSWAPATVAASRACGDTGIGTEHAARCNAEAGGFRSGRLGERVWRLLTLWGCDGPGCARYGACDDHQQTLNTPVLGRSGSANSDNRPVAGWLANENPSATSVARRA